MADLLSGGVMRGIIGASSAMKSADAAMSVYTYAKTQKDDDMMQRALGQMTDRMNDAAASTEESKTALAENVKSARKQIKAEQEARIEKARSAKAAEERDRTQANLDKVNSEGINPIDTVEISPEAIAILLGEQSCTPIQSKDTTAPVQHTEKSVSANGG